MKFSVGYKVTGNNSFMEYIVENKEHIHELYFSWGDIPNGRNSMLQNEIFLPWQAQNKQIEDLKHISKNGEFFGELGKSHRDRLTIRTIVIK